MNNTTTAKQPCKLIFADFKNKMKVGERYVTQTPWMCNVCGHSYLYTPEADRKPGQKIMKYLPLTVRIPVANKMNKVERKINKLTFVRSVLIRYTWHSKIKEKVMKPTKKTKLTKLQ